MFRALLTYLSIFAAAAGPLPCCCAGGRPVAPLALAQPGPRGDTPSHSCCGHRAEATTTAVSDAPTLAPQTHHDGSPKGPCACENGREKTAVAPTSVRAEDAGGVWPVTLDAILSVTVRGCPADGGVTHTGRDGPALFPSAAELLYAHHKLRC